MKPLLKEPNGDPLKDDNMDTKREAFGHHSSELKGENAQSQPVDQDGIGIEHLYQSNCGNCESNIVKVFQCSACKCTKYCSRACQKKNWLQHKHLCEAIVTLEEENKERVKDLCEVGHRSPHMEKLVNLVGRKTEVGCQIDSMKCTAVWDTGAMVSLVSENWLLRYCPEKEVCPITDLLEDELLVRDAGQHHIPYLGYLFLSISLLGLLALRCHF